MEPWYVELTGTAKGVMINEEGNFLLMTAGFMKGEDYLRWMERSIDRRIKHPPVNEFPSLEAHVSWISTAMMRDALYRVPQLKEREDLVASAPLETIIIAPGANDPPHYAMWFEGIENAPSYRIAIHRSPIGTGAIDQAITCGAIYGTEHCPIDCVVEVDFLQSLLALPFLRDLSRAYNESAEAVDEIVGKYNNPYWVYNDTEENYPTRENTPD